jgi:ribosomal protein S20
MTTEKQLLDLKNQIDKAKESMAVLKGQEKTLLKQLKDEYQCNDLSEAKQLIISMDKEISKLKKEIEEQSEELEKYL